MMKFIFLFITALLVAGCINENQEEAIESESNPFSNAISDQIDEAYILRPSEWSLTEDGKALFNHIIEDAYRGLQVISSTSDPIADLVMQLGRDIENFTNLLSVQASFSSAQSMRMRLPFSMFGYTGGFLTLSDSIDYDNYTYTFQAEGSADRIDITHEADSEGAYVTLDAQGVVYVTRICDDPNNRQADNSCDTPSASNDFNIVPPTLNYHHYSNAEPVYLTLTWPNPSGLQAECSIGDSSSFSACTTDSSLRLTPQQINSDSNVVVQLSDGTSSTYNIGAADSPPSMT